MNLYEVTLHGTNSIYLLASTKHRAQKLAGELITWRTNLANAKGRLYWQLGNHGGDRHGTDLGFSFACPKGFTAPNRYPRIVIGRSAFLVLIPRVDEDGNAFAGTGSSAFRPE